MGRIKLKWGLTGRKGWGSWRSLKMLINWDYWHCVNDCCATKRFFTCRCISSWMDVHLAFSTLVWTTTMNCQWCQTYQLASCSYQKNPSGRFQNRGLETSARTQSYSCMDVSRLDLVLRWSTSGAKHTNWPNAPTLYTISVIHTHKHLKYKNKKEVLLRWLICIWYLQHSAVRNTEESKTFAQLPKWNGRLASALQCGLLECNTVQCIAVHCITVQWNVRQCIALQNVYFNAVCSGPEAAHS